VNSGSFREKPPLPDGSRTTCFLIAAVLLCSYAYFYQGGGWNQNSRFDLIRAIVEEHTLRIDSFHQNTLDKAHIGGHYYSDKSPGLAFLALPAVYVTRSMLKLDGVDAQSPWALVTLSYVATFFAVALPSAIAFAGLFVISLRLGLTPTAGAFAALSLGLATPMWAYATLLWGHALAGACLLLAFWAAVELRGVGNNSMALQLGLLVGLLAGWATVSEYPAAPASAMVALLALALVWKNRGRMIAAFSGVVLGASICIAILMSYQYNAFGSALRPSYSYYDPGAFPWMRHGLLGLTYPRIDVAFKLVFGARRGLFPIAPVLIAAPFGLRVLWKSGSRLAAAAAAGIAVYYWLFNAAFPAWHGGWSYGPRYMSAGIPLLALGLAPAWDAASQNSRRVLALLAAVSLFFTVAAVSTSVQPLEGMKFPLVQLGVPNFIAGNLSLDRGTMLDPVGSPPGAMGGSFNFGELLGLHGLPSLAPLFALWGLTIWLFRRHNRLARESDSP
jgi:hypothetical protein